jgi:hypothetical protein
MREREREREREIERERERENESERERDVRQNIINLDLRQSHLTTNSRGVELDRV